MDCVSLVSIALGCNEWLAREWRAIFVSFFSFSRYLASNVHSIRLNFVQGTVVLPGITPQFADIFVYWDITRSCYHISLAADQDFTPLCFSEMPKFLESINIYSDPNPVSQSIPNPAAHTVPARGDGKSRPPRQAKPLPNVVSINGAPVLVQAPLVSFQAPQFPPPVSHPAARQQRNQSNHQQQNQRREGNNRSQNRERGQRRDNRSQERNQHAPRNDRRRNENNNPNNNNNPPPNGPNGPNGGGVGGGGGGGAAPVVPPAPAVVPIPSSLAFWLGLVGSLNITPGSEEAEKWLIKNGILKNKLNLVVQHAHPISRAKRHLMYVKLLAHFFHGIAIATPFHWVRPSASLINLANTVLRSRSTQIAGLIEAALFVGQTFETLNVAGAHPKIVCDTFDRQFSQHAEGSLFCFRLWTDSSASIDNEVTVDPVRLLENFNNDAIPRYFRKEQFESELLVISVEGSGSYIEPANMLFHLSDCAAKVNQKLKFLTTPCNIGDYGLYKLVTADTDCTAVTKSFAHSIIPQTIDVTYPDIPGVLWWLMGESAPRLLPASFSKSVTVLNLSLDVSSMSSNGSSYTSTQIPALVDKHPIIKDLRRPEKVRTDLRIHTTTYYAYRVSHLSSSVARNTSGAGTSLSSIDINRNLFSITTLFGCCGQRQKHAGAQ